MSTEYDPRDTPHTAQSLRKACQQAEEGDFLAMWADVQDLGQDALDDAKAALPEGLRWQTDHVGISAARKIA